MRCKLFYVTFFPCFGFPHLSGRPTWLEGLTLTFARLLATQLMDGTCYFGNTQQLGIDIAHLVRYCKQQATRRPAILIAVILFS